MKLYKDTTKYYGNYRAVVLDNDDSFKQGRIKVNVIGMTDGIKASFLPWAVPAMPLHNGSASGKGYLAIPAVNTSVWIFFEAGDIQQPVYFAEAPTATTGVPTEAETNYPNRIVKKSGNITIIQDNTEDLLQISHPNATVMIANDGSVTVDSDKTITLSNSSSSIVMSDTGIITLTGANIKIVTT